MKLHELSSTHKKTKRVGRGGKRGTTSGRGTKGQKSRSGHRMRPAQRDLILRIPKHRGFRNKPQGPEAIVFNVGFLSDRLKRDGQCRRLVVTGCLVQRFKGVRMFHCHILEHEGAGMMGQLKVV